MFLSNTVRIWTDEYYKNIVLWEIFYWKEYCQRLEQPAACRRDPGSSLWTATFPAESRASVHWRKSSLHHLQKAALYRLIFGNTEHHVNVTYWKKAVPKGRYPPNRLSIWIFKSPMLSFASKLSMFMKTAPFLWTGRPWMSIVIPTLSATVK